MGGGGVGGCQDSSSVDRRVRSLLSAHPFLSSEEPLALLLLDCLPVVSSQRLQRLLVAGNLTELLMLW